MAAYEVLLLNTTLPQIQAAQAGDTYVVPRDITFSTNATFTTGTANGVMYLNGDKVVSTGSLLTFNGTTFTAPSLSLTNALSTTSGGTGLSSFTAGDLTYYSTGTALSKLAIGTANQVLTSSGTAPQWTSLSSIGVTSVSFGSTGLTPSSATAGAVSVAGTLVTSNGGTGLSSYTAGDLVYYSTGTALSKLAIGTASQILTSSGSAPQWSTASGISVGTATNLAGGAAGSVPYQSGAGATTFLSIGAANRVLTSTGSAPQWVTSLTGLTGVSSSSITNTALTSGRVVYSTTGGAQTDSASLTFDGTTFATTTVDTTNLEVTNIKAKDGTAAASIADSTGVVTVTAAPVMSALTASQAVFTTAGKALTSNPITGTGNVVMSASPTLTGTVAAAAVTLSSDLTLSGGTANGVLYLNGSKAATSGSALTFDGTNFATTGTASATKLIPTGGAITGNGMYLPAANNVAITTNGANAIYIDSSQNVGIGTSSPAARLDVQQPVFQDVSARISTGSLTVGNYSQLVLLQNAFSTTLGWVRSYGTSYGSSLDSGMEVWNLQNSFLRFGNNNVERMRLDTSGNLRLGTTSSLSAADRLTVVGGNIAVQRTSGITTFMGDNTQDGYVGTVTNHAFAFLTNSTERMRLDSSGNLGLGVTPSAWYVGAGTSKAIQFNASSALYDFSASGNRQTHLINNAYLNTSANWIYLNTDAASRYVQNAGIHSWHTAASGTAGNPITFTQAMTLDASGKLLINATTSPSAATVKVAIQGASGSDSYYQFGNGSGGGGLIGSVVSGGIQMYTYTGAFGSETYTERARITSDGYLLVGTTAAGGDARLVVNNPDNVSGDFCFVTLLGSNCNNTNSYHYIASTGNADKFYVYGNGNVVNVNNSYGTLSDVKLKENIVDATPKLADVMRLQVRNFNLKTEPGHKQIGFVAQEFEQVFPAMVDESFDRDEEGNQLETTTKHIKTSVLVPILVKAIQEQQTIIQSLTARIAALESKGV